VRGGLYPQADEAYKRALQTNHVAAGFYNLEQMKILDGLSESYLGLDKLGQANAQQRAQVAIQERRSGENSRDLVPALDKLGRWYNRTGQYPESRAAYQSARRIIRETGGDSDPAMVDALLGEALTYENEGAMPAAASALKRALDLLAARPGENQLKRAEVLVALGDHYNVTRQFRSARQRYAQAWQELSGDDALLSQREEYFRAPTRISGPRLPEFVGADGKETQGPRNAPVEFAEGIVVATLTVSPDGQAIDTAIIESDPPGLLDKQLLRTMAASAFRPQLVDGSGVPSPGIQFRHPFRYQRPSPERPEVRAEPAAEPTGEKGKRIGYPGQPDGADGDPQR
jgi:tetratricopeptide (TPR) repeat protein